MADKKFGMRVKLRRMQLGLTQTQLAKKIGESSGLHQRRGAGNILPALREAD